MKGSKMTGVNEVKSCLEVTLTERGELFCKVIEGIDGVPEDASRIAEIFTAVPKTLRFYHRPDCAWFTKTIMG